MSDQNVSPPRSLVKSHHTGYPHFASCSESHRANSLSSGLAWLRKTMSRSDCLFPEIMFVVSTRLCSRSVGLRGMLCTVSVIFFPSACDKCSQRDPRRCLPNRCSAVDKHFCLLC